ncbi:hypothetical protein ACWEKM_36555 [Streptomyces sp. NPDC004752]
MRAPVGTRATAVRSRAPDSAQRIMAHRAFTRPSSVAGSGRAVPPITFASTMCRSARCAEAAGRRRPVVRPPARPPSQQGHALAQRHGDAQPHGDVSAVHAFTTSDRRRSGLPRPQVRDGAGDTSDGRRSPAQPKRSMRMRSTG